MRRAYHPPNLLGAPNHQLQSSSVCIVAPQPLDPTHVQAAAMGDPRESSSYSVVPHLKYNTVGGVNGPLVILEDVITSSQMLPDRQIH